MSSGSRTLFLPSLLVGAVALAGCGSSEASSDSGAAPDSNRPVYEFAYTPDSTPDGEITVQFPDGLTEAMEIDSVTVPVKSLTLRSQEVKSTSLCAVEGHVEFNEGGEAIAIAPTRTADDVDGKEDPGIADLNFMLDDSVLRVVHSLQQSGELPKGAYEEAQKAPYTYYKANLQGKESWLDDHVAEMEKMYLSSDAEKDAEKKGLAAMTPANWAARFYGVAMDAPYGGEILPMSQFDADKPEEGVYMDSPDSFIEVLPCAKSADDRATTRITSFDFQRVDDKRKSGFDRFAFVSVGVMRDGTITIPSAKVFGYTRDGSGSWVQKRK